jgi:hypothetical protein
MDVPDDLDLFARMCFLRRFEERADSLYRQGLIHGPLHLGLGQEAIAVGAASVLRPGDYSLGTYRGHAVLDSYGTYLAHGGFLPARMLEFWEAKARQSPCADGPGFARNIGDMSWAHRNERVVGDLIGYESELNRIMANFPQVNLCLYDLTRCSGELIMDVLKTHPKALLGGMVIDNPYYLEPDEFLASRLDPG